MASKEVAERVAPAVPDLIRTPALEITAEDIALPRLYIGQFMSKAVQEKLVDLGDIYSATGADDPDPQILPQPVRFHVLALKKGKSYAESGGELEIYDYNDPAAPAEAWVTYQYTLALPEVDAEVPFKILLTRTGKPAAMQINTVLAKRASAGPAWINAFDLTSATRENKKGKYAIARVASSEADPKHVEIAQNLGVMVSTPAPSDFRSTNEEPAI